MLELGCRQKGTTRAAGARADISHVHANEQPTRELGTYNANF